MQSTVLQTKLGASYKMIGLRHLVSSSVPKSLRSLFLLGLVLFIFSSAFPPLDLAAQVNLAIHMGQHALIAISGVPIGYTVYLQRKLAGRTPKKDYAISSIILVAAIVAFWHLPTTWDAAVLDPVIHGTEHISFLTVGFLIGLFFPVLPDNFKFMSVFLAASGHMAYGIYLFIMTSPVYPLYSLDQQHFLAILMLFPSPAYFIGLMVVSLNRETRRLEELDIIGERLSLQNGKRFSGKGKRSWGQVAIPAVTLLLIAIFVGYLAVTTGIIYSSSAADPRGDENATVFILETPFTWQYSPQSIVVIIGVNNTVVWVSHSLTEDTVTSDSGYFHSSVLDPGQSWSYTFSKPGAYTYFCEFHPWMRGSVTVLPSAA